MLLEKQYLLYEFFYFFKFFLLFSKIYILPLLFSNYFPMKYHFSWIGVVLLASTLATSVSAKHYTFYAPITEQVVVHTAEQSDQ